MKIKFVLLTIFSIQFFYFSSSQALVDLKSGSYIHPTDDFIVSDSGLKNNITRIYKSKTLYDGVFGFGWCSPFETKLQVTAEGDVLLIECGSGAEIEFTGANSLSAKESADNILKAMKSDAKFKSFSEAYYSQLKNELLNNSSKRNELAAQLNLLPAFKNGQVLNSKSTNYAETITVVDGEFKRFKSDLSTEKFDKTGRLLQIVDPKGNYIKYSYTEGQLTKIEDNNANTYLIKYGANKKISEIKAGGNFAVYTYVKNDLVRVELKDANKVLLTWNYEYDSLHNLTKAANSLKDSYSIKYDNERDVVVSYEDSLTKCSEAFTYTTNDQPNNWFQSSESTEKCEKASVNKMKYQIWYAKSLSGDLKEKKIATTRNSSMEIFEYDIETGNKTSQTIDGLKIAFDYFADGKLKSRKSKYQSIEFSYDKNNRNVNSAVVKQLNKSGKLAGAVTTKVQYDVGGRPRKLVNSKGATVQYEYDEESRIAKMKLTQKAKKNKNILRTLAFTYDEKLNRPKQIDVSDLGDLAITYNRLGEVTTLQSSKGQDRAKEIFESYESAISLMDPVKVEFYK